MNNGFIHLPGNSAHKYSDRISKSPRSKSPLQAQIKLKLNQTINHNPNPRLIGATRLTGSNMI